jgi:hypothetical protein
VTDQAWALIYLANAIAALALVEDEKSLGWRIGIDFWIGFCLITCIVYFAKALIP